MTNDLELWLRKEAEATPERQWHDAANFFIGLKKTAAPRAKAPKAKTASVISHLGRLAGQAGGDVAGGLRKVKAEKARGSISDSIDKAVYRAKHWGEDAFERARDAARSQVSEGAVLHKFVSPERRLKWYMQRRDTPLLSRLGAQASLDAGALVKAKGGTQNLQAAKYIGDGKDLSEKLRRLNKSGLLPKGQTGEQAILGATKGGVGGLMAARTAAKRRARNKMLAIAGGGTTLGVGGALLMKSRKQGGSQVT